MFINTKNNHSKTKKITPISEISSNFNFPLVRKKNYKVAAFIVNYNMPERAEELFKNLQKNSKWPLDIYLIDNGSDLKEPAKSTNIFIKKNVQTCRGWLEGLKYAKKTGITYFAYMFLITSTNFIDNSDPISPMVKFLIKNENAVGIHPSLTKESTTNWTHLISRDENNPRETWMIDNIASLYKSDWFDSIGWFDPELIYAWGIDLETCYLARKEKRTLWVDDRLQVTKITNIAYKMKRMNMSANDRSRLAAENMKEVLTKKYGENYWKKMTEDFITSAML